MNSRYLLALKERIERTESEADLVHLLAERAAYLARLGDVISARDDINYIRVRVRVGGDARLSILLNFADGLCHYYQNMGNESRDRLARAYAIAVATGDFEMASRSAAWLALLAYGVYDFSAMSMHLAASATATSGDPISKARNFLTIAQTIHLANRFDLARKWYQQARFLANKVEDDAMISALLHNMSSISVANIRNAELGGIETVDRSTIAMAGVSSTQNFDDMMGATSQPVFTPLARAQLLSTEGKYSEALDLYESNMYKLEIEAAHGWQKWLLADRAWCFLNIGAPDRARSEFERVLEMMSDRDHVDDRAATLKQISKGYRMLGLEADALRCAGLAEDCWASFRQLQSDMLAMTTNNSSWRLDD